MLQLQFSFNYIFQLSIGKLVEDFHWDLRLICLSSLVLCISKLSVRAPYLGTLRLSTIQPAVESLRLC